MGAGEGTVDTGGGLGRVTTEEGLFVENDDVATVQVDGVGGTEAGHCDGQRDTREEKESGERERRTYNHRRPQLLGVLP